MKYTEIKGTITLEKNKIDTSLDLKNDWLLKMLNSFVKTDLGPEFNIKNIRDKEMLIDNVKYHVTISIGYKSGYHRWLGKSDLKKLGFKDRQIKFI